MTSNAAFCKPGFRRCCCHSLLAYGVCCRGRSGPVEFRRAGPRRVAGGMRCCRLLSVGCRRRAGQEFCSRLCSGAVCSPPAVKLRSSPRRPSRHKRRTSQRSPRLKRRLLTPIDRRMPRLKAVPRSTSERVPRNRPPQLVKAPASSIRTKLQKMISKPVEGPRRNHLAPNRARAWLSLKCRQAVQRRRAIHAHRNPRRRDQ
jgi:hypothetical protein